jgi:DNA-directed RNA polymerase specialized sigma24 family protein
MSVYTRELVEQLLPAVWDHNTAWGMTNPTAADPDMPRTTTDPAHAGTLYAHIADIRTGWEQAALSSAERRTLLMRYGLDWRHKTIARHEHVASSAVTKRLAQGVGRIAQTLNGEQAEELEPAT